MPVKQIDETIPKEHTETALKTSQTTEEASEVNKTMQLENGRKETVEDSLVSESSSEASESPSNTPSSTDDDEALNSHTKDSSSLSKQTKSTDNQIAKNIYQNGFVKNKKRFSNNQFYPKNIAHNQHFIEQPTLFLQPQVHFINSPFSHYQRRLKTNLDYYSNVNIIILLLLIL